MTSFACSEQAVCMEPFSSLYFWVKKKGGLSNATSILAAPWCAHTSGSKGDLWEPGAAGQRQI